MAVKTAQQVAEKYQRRMAAAGPDFEAGVRNPSRPWEQATVAGADRYAVGVQEAISDNRFARGVQGRGDKWARRVQTVGVQRYSASAQAAAAEFGAVADKMMSIATASSQRTSSMPGATFEDRIQRMTENARFIRDQWRGNR